ncbi:MAG: TolC family protein [Desulfobacterales bacterium]|nr:TolC family protein [Desulfobacterales bacterium]
MARAIAAFIHLVCLLAALSLLQVSPARAEGGDLAHTMKLAISCNPQIAAAVQRYKAAQAEIKKQKKRYMPSLDMTLGYGVEQYNDALARKNNRERDWDGKSEASLSLVQRIYDGGETRQQIAIQQAILDAETLGVLSRIQSVALDAVSAHLQVWRNIKMLALELEICAFYQDTVNLLAEKERAGVGSIADVVQTQARLASARQRLSMVHTELREARFQYHKVTGRPPGKIMPVPLPTPMPPSLDSAIKKIASDNIELLAMAARFRAAKEGVALVDTAWYPRVNLKLSTNYQDQFEGKTSWENSNEAMMTLRWNIFNGGMDHAKRESALARESEQAHLKAEKQLEIQRLLSFAWVRYQSLMKQRKDLEQGKEYSWQTFVHYKGQFHLSKRSLIDVLNAKQDYYNFARQLIDIPVKEVLEAYQILSFTGTLPMEVEGSSP